MQKTFKCAECGEVLAVRNLSRQSRKDAETSIPEAALAILDPDLLLCKPCGDGIEEDEAAWQSRPGRSDRERFELSGLTISPANWQAYCLSY